MNNQIKDLTFEELEDLGKKGRENYYKKNYYSLVKLVHKLEEEIEKLKKEDKND